MKRASGMSAVPTLPTRNRIIGRERNEAGAPRAKRGRARLDEREE